MDSVHFKYRLLNDAGQETGILSTRGEVTEESLILGKEIFPIAAVTQVVRRMDRLIFVLVADGSAHTIKLAVNSGGARTVKERVDGLTSARWADLRRRELEQAGDYKSFRTMGCPNCRATVDLTGFAATPEMYCSFCETVSRGRGESSPESRTMHLCDICGYFSNPETFTSFYFYFLLVVYGFQSKKTQRCHGCMRGEAWKMLAANALFVLGAPFALWQVLRAHFMGSHRSSYPGLDTANQAALAGSIDKAETLYLTMLECAPVAAGIHLNRAKAYAQVADWRGCLQSALNSLSACSNYSPAGGLVLQSLRSQNMLQEADVFEQNWGKEGLEAAKAEEPAR